MCANGGEGYAGKLTSKYCLGKIVVVEVNNLCNKVLGLYSSARKKDLLWHLALPRVDMG